MTRLRRPRSVAARLLVSYVVVLFVFAGAAAWSVGTFRAAVAEAELLRQGYLPLALSLRDLVASQDTWNSQLNHITDAKNPADKRIWFETSLAVGRHRKLAEVRHALDLALPPADASASLSRREFSAELERAARLMEPDTELVSQLFTALEREDQSLAEERRDRLVSQGIRVQRALIKLEKRVGGSIDVLVEEAREREKQALSFLVLVGLLTLATGALMAAYARRVVAPLSTVTRRAQAVAHGDLSPREPLNSGDEIGELSGTFEGMVQAIAEAREKLLASERLAAIGKMAAHVTHEIRNPLSSIALNLDLLEDEVQQIEGEGGREEVDALLHAIGQEVQRLTVLSDQYLSMARRKAPELEESDIGMLVQDAVEFMRRDVERNQIELSCDVAAALPWVSVDTGQLRQALFNLLRNAREAMPDGGHVWVSVEANDSQLLVLIEDDGPGVPEDRVEQLFDPFFTTKDHGTGLGLAVTRQILVAHGGRLDYAPRKGGGSRFSLILPSSVGDS